MSPRDVLLVDDHPIFRAGLGQLIEESSECRACGSVASAQAALDHIAEHRCDAMVLDVDMPGRSGLDALPEILRIRPDLPVVVLTFHPEDQYAIRAVELGARGYLTKSAAGDDLVEALHTVTRGEFFVSSEVAGRMAKRLVDGGPAAPREQLSDRELQVLRLIAEGLSNGEISVKLGLSPKTVSTYKTRVLTKLELTSTAQVVRYALEHDLVS